jgi:hypothetical protein
MTADDDLELCQLAIVIMDNAPAKDPAVAAVEAVEAIDEEDAVAPVPIGVAKFDGDDLATVLGNTLTMPEELKVYPYGRDELVDIDKDDRKSYGSVMIQSCKGSTFFEFFVRNCTDVRMETKLDSNPQHYCIVYWNREELGRTMAVAAEQDPTWVKPGVNQTAFSVTTFPFDFVFQCRLEVQLWACVRQQDLATAKIPREFLGAAVLEEEALEAFLLGDPFYLNRVEKKLAMSLNVQRDQRGNVCQGTMTLVGGRAG